MDTPSGLLVPNIKSVQTKSLLDIGLELARLQRDAANGKLAVDDLKGGTFTLSNIGNLGGTYTGPVINLPEVKRGGACEGGEGEGARQHAHALTLSRSRALTLSRSHALVQAHAHAHAHT
eukprot:939724-Pleurochrysis_carterae.AAC.5